MDEPRRYRKRPLEVEALQWTGDNLPAVCVFVEGPTGPKGGWVLIRWAENDDLKLWIDKSDGWGTVRLKDWIIAERDGAGFYPCSSEQFDEIYEPVEE